MSIKIHGHHEDMISKNKDFIQELSKVQDMYFETLFEEIKDEGFPEKFKDFLSDFVFSDDSELTFEEYLVQFNLDKK